MVDIKREPGEYCLDQFRLPWPQGVAFAPAEKSARGMRFAIHRHRRPNAERAKRSR
jgi:hypothetical protein